MQEVIGSTPLTGFDRTGDGDAIPARIPEATEEEHHAFQQLLLSLLVQVKLRRYTDRYVIFEASFGKHQVMPAADLRQELMQTVNGDDPDLLQ